jgi:N-acetylmuramoyl-L-alanine amidase
LKVYIDPGHVAHDSGAVAADGTTEASLNGLIAIKLLGEIEARGHTAILGKGGTLEERASEANASNAQCYNTQCFVSIHCNEFSDADAEGIEVWRSPDASDEAVNLSEAVMAELRNIPGHKDRGVKDGHLYVLHHTAMPAILIECEFLSNARQLAWLQDPAGQRAIAQAIATGLDFWACS